MTKVLVERNLLPCLYIQRLFLIMPNSLDILWPLPWPLLWSSLCELIIPIVPLSLCRSLTKVSTFKHYLLVHSKDIKKKYQDHSGLHYAFSTFFINREETNMGEPIVIILPIGHPMVLSSENDTARRTCLCFSVQYVESRVHWSHHPLICPPL